MKIPQLARYNGTVSTAYNFIYDNITEFPVNPFKLINKFKWGLLTYNQMAKENNCTVEDICECLGTDGYSIYNGTNYTIAYNNNQPSKRINFTLAHEIGHIILNHHKDFNVTEVLKDNFTQEEYKILENEANCFARNILAPAPLSKNIPFLFKQFKLSDIFDISFSAVNTRLSFLKSDLNYLTTTQIFNMQQKYDTYLQCTNCGTNYIDTNSIFCCACGSTKLKKGKGFIMKEYKEKNIKDNGECPICENSNIKIEDNYCKICGFSFKNLCPICGAELDSNARFCNYCGSSSTYFKNGILHSWEVENLNYNLSSLELKKIWQNFNNYLKINGRIVLYTNLLYTNLVIINETTMGIDFVKGITTFGFAVINKKENIDYIADEISKFVGKKIKLKYLSQGAEIKDNEIQEQQVSDDDLPF